MSKFVTRGASGKERYFIDGKQVSQEEFDRALSLAKEALPQVAEPAEEVFGTGNWKTPILSDALAVHPDQIEQVMERNRGHGLHVEYERQFGRPILRSRAEQRALMKIEQCHDNNCYN